MSDRRVLLVIAFVVLAPAAGAVVVSAAPVENEAYAVAQGTTCTVVEPVTNESQTAAEFYDYRNPDTEPNSSTFSSFGTTEYQETHTSALLFYEGSDAASIVLVHGELGDGLGGSTLTMGFEGLPADGEWVVEDDEYTNRDDDWSTGETSATIDWKWGPNRTDGGVYSGIGNVSGPIVVTPGFNEDATHWGDWSYSGSDADRVASWRLIDADGSETLLDRDRRLFVHGGGCEVTPPSAALSGPNSTETGESITLDAGGTTDDGPLGGYEWDFDGDGEFEAVTAAPTVDHTFTAAGNHTVAVTAFDTYGNGDTAELQVNVTVPSTPPNASLDAAESATVNESVTLDASNSTDEGTITGYAWDLDGDGERDRNTTDPVIEHTYNETGTATPAVTVVDDDNETATATASIEIQPANQPPTAALDAPAEVRVDQPVTFDASNATDDQGIAEYRWDFDGNGTIDATTTEPVVEHAYGNTSASVEASVTVVDSAGLNDTASTSVTVLPDTPPNASLDAPGNATVGTPATFDASNATDDVGIDEYRWDFEGDGTIDATSTEPTVEYVYDDADEFAPAVTVVDDDNETATATASITVSDQANATAAFTVETAEPTAGDPVRFNASDANASTPIASYDWAFGDGAAGSGVAVDHVYDTAGEYEVTLSITTEGGETANASTTVSVAAADSGGNGGGTDGGNSGGGGNDGGSTDGGSTDDGDSGGSGTEQSTATPEPDPEPDIGGANVTLSTQELLVGETLVAEATVTNRGNASGTKTVEFEVEGEQLESRRIPLAPGESRNVSFSHQFTSPGVKAVEVDQGRTWHVEVRPREPNISVASLRVDEREVAPGEQFTIVANVTNTGDAPGERTVALELFGETVATENVSLAVGDSERVTFTRSVVAAGSYDATVGNQSVQVTVVEASETTEEPTSTTTESPGFGALTALAALAAVAAALVRRRG